MRWNGINSCLRIISAKQVFVLSLSLLLLLRFDTLVESTSTPTDYKKVDEMLCERRRVANSDEKEERSVLVCTFVVDETTDSESTSTRSGTNTYRSCVLDDCVTAHVSVARESRSETKQPRVVPEETDMSNKKTATTENDQSQTNNGKASTSPGRGESNQNDSRRFDSYAARRPIIMGQASYQPPYIEQYGLAVGQVLLSLQDLGLRDGQLENNEPSIELVSWCLELGHAHMDDAELGMVFVDGDLRKRSKENHPKNYHIELALQAYNWASKTLFAMTKETEFIDIDPMREANKEKMVRLQYYGIIEYSKGEAFTIAGEDDISSSYSNEFFSSALDTYRKAQASFEKLRYIYARLSKTDSDANAFHNNDEKYFNEERYYLIENFYAHACFQLAMSLYSKLILEQNEKINRANEKIMELTKTGGIGLEDEDLDVVTALMDQAKGVMGGPRLGATSNTARAESLGDLNSILGGNWMEDELGFGGSSEEKFALEEITGLLDAAILTYQEHANPQQSSDNGGKQAKPTKIIVNGVSQKSLEEYQEEERLFPWQSSLAMAYEKAATVATMRNQHIRSRELMNLALEVYSGVIIPYYRDQEARERKLMRSDEIRRDIRTSSSTSSISIMSRGYAAVSAGRLYVTLADTTSKLGNYKDAKNAYSKAMEWYTQHQLTPEADGIFNTISGDEISLREYEAFASTFRQELDQYFEDVKNGYMYRDDSYEAGMSLSLAQLYMAMGKAEPAIVLYKDATIAYERFSKDYRTNKSEHKMAVLGLADARFGLASAYFHVRRFEDSKVEHALSCDIYLQMFGEGTPPQTESEAALEDMKDMIVENFGEDYYDMLKTYYTDGAGTENAAGIGSEGSNKPATVATNFNGFDYDNETMWEDQEDDEYEYGGAKDTWSDEEL